MEKVTKYIYVHNSYISYYFQKQFNLYSNWIKKYIQNF